MAADIRLRPRGHWDRRFVLLTKFNSGVQSKKSGMDGSCDTYGGDEVHAGFWWENQTERNHLEGLNVDGSIIIMWTLKKWDGEENGLICLRIWTVFLLFNEAMNSGFYKMRGISWLADDLLASQERHRSVQLLLLLLLSLIFPGKYFTLSITKWILQNSVRKWGYKCW